MGSEAGVDELQALACLGAVRAVGEVALESASPAGPDLVANERREVRQALLALGVEPRQTAVGLGVAIAALVPFNFFNSRAEEMLDTIERYGSRLELLLVEAAAHRPRPATGAS